MFEVRTLWNDSLRIHRARSFAEALEWAKCYATPVSIYTLAGELVAQRG